MLFKEVLECQKPSRYLMSRRLDGKALRASQQTIVVEYNRRPWAGAVHSRPHVE